jgi:hypothetical protein
LPGVKAVRIADSHMRTTLTIRLINIRSPFCLFPDICGTSQERNWCLALNTGKAKIRISRKHNEGKPPPLWYSMNLRLENDRFSSGKRTCSIVCLSQA